MAQVEKSTKTTMLRSSGQIFLKSSTPPYDGDDDRPRKGIVVEASSVPSPPIHHDLQHVIPVQDKPIPDDVT